MAVFKGSILTTKIDWRKIADLVWGGLTVPQACVKLEYDFEMVTSEMSLNQRCFLVDTSVLANAREEQMEQG